MENLNIIDDFLSTFSTYLDSGFGLLGGDVHALSTILIGIDVTLAGLFWTLGGEDDVLAKFIRKVLYIGAFAYIIGNYAALSTIIFKSFSQAGLTAGGGTITADQLLKPGRLAGTGFSAAWPLLVQASKSLGIANFFQNFLTIAVLLTAWIIVIISFFILAVQLFITILEFKLTGLAGFILVPFALWNRTNFLAERVLGNVVTSGIKVMVLAVIVGIGSTYFSQFTAALQGKEPDIGQAMSLVLASLALLGLGIFGPTIASGLVAGAQLGAGSVAATGALVAGGAAAVASGGVAAAGAIGGAGLGAIRAGASMGPAAFKAYRGGQLTLAPAPSAPALPVSTMLPAAKWPRVPRKAVRAADAGAEKGRTGRNRAKRQLRQICCPDTSEGSAEAPPPWARKIQAQQDARHRQQMITHTVQSGDQGGAGAIPTSMKRRIDPMHFKRAVQRYGQTPQPETPYQRAGQLWDERIGTARVQAANWRLMAFGTLALATGSPWPGLAVAPKPGGALCRRGRSSGRGAGRHARRSGLSAHRSSDRLVPVPLYQGCALALARSGVDAGRLAASL
jgi:type IV secretion system protein TrbL